jgi:hypothetical protein
MGGSREGMSKGGSVVADADAEESGGQPGGPTGGPSQPADYTETPSEVRVKIILHEKLMLVYVQVRAKVCVGYMGHV